ncbi:hypothetical protein [Kibdelosporangium phytohabitans]|uniref:Uncharacterized protein n=1 Tax=Kibdelosporangium phytohabitans TaxID=860235 RepID=A0A0N7F2E0_9PSEU|nr:hypothetical protein [Kibdelosporangium phytohabitans]ALG05567.1 hypothetical protein AOZ06_00260 [Kibdelosporangium phytohabitans]MBE1466473.1 hypothetical protein [Kibdelosporangium phytohabitans]
MRGWTLAVSSGALAVAAHGMVGGATPDAALAVLLTMIVAWAGTSVASRVDGPLSVLTALGMAQGAMHLVLNYAVPSHTAHHMAPVDPVVMTAAHTAATALTALLLAKADAAVHLISTAMRLLLDLAEPPRFPVVASATYALPESPDRIDHIRAVLLRRVHSRRGPPARS